MISAIVLTALLIFLAVFFFRKGFRFVTSEPNEWMLVIRNGKVTKSGVGISSYIYLGDKVVKFPSRINKVKFTAQQVTKEMQGIEVSGVIIWAIYRDKEGPSRAYKMLGDDLKRKVPTTANQNLIDIANSIVRDRIANSTIDTIIKNRSVIRDEIRKVMNEVVIGWGVWLESVEITDVRILSGKLFKNLQTEFREEQRQKAELIQMRISRELEEKRMNQQVEMSKKKADNATQVSIYQLNQNLKIKEEEQVIFTKDQEIQKQRLDSQQKLKLHRFDNDCKYNSQVKEKNQEQELKDIDRQIEEEKKQQEVNRVIKETEKLNAESEAKIRRMNEAMTVELKKKKLEMKNEIYKKTPLKFHALNSIQEIYRHLPVSEMKVCNFGNSGKDQIGGVVGKIMATVNEMKE